MKPRKPTTTQPGFGWRPGMRTLPRDASHSLTHAHLFLTRGTMNSETTDNAISLKRSMRPVKPFIMFVHLCFQTLWLPEFIMTQRKVLTHWVRKTRKIIIVHSGCFDKHQKRGELREQTLFLTVLEAEKSKIQVLPDSVLTGTHFLIHKTAESPCVLTWWTGEGPWTKPL